MDNFPIPLSTEAVIIESTELNISNKNDKTNVSKTQKLERLTEVNHR